MAKTYTFNPNMRCVVAGEEPYQFTFTRQGHGDKYTVEYIARTIISIGDGIGHSDFERMKCDGVFKISQSESINGGKIVQFEEVKDKKNGKPPKGFRIDPRYIELKSKRYNALLKPSNFDKLKAAAEEAGVSVNEALNRLIEAALPDNK